MQWQSIHVEYDDGSGDLRLRLHHGRLEKENYSLENFVQIALGVFPLLSKLEQEYPTTELVSFGQYCYYVLLEDVFLFAGHQLIVDVAVLYFEGVVPLDLRKIFWKLVKSVCMLQEPGLAEADGPTADHHKYKKLNFWIYVFRTV